MNKRLGEFFSQLNKLKYEEEPDFYLHSDQERELLKNILGKDLNSLRRRYVVSTKDFFIAKNENNNSVAEEQCEIFFSSPSPKKKVKNSDDIEAKSNDANIIAEHEAEIVNYFEDHFTILFEEELLNI